MPEPMTRDEWDDDQADRDRKIRLEEAQLARRDIRFHVPGIPDHIVAGIELDESSDCWLWRKSKSRDGYGWTSLNNRTYQAHRLVYRLLVGEPPEGTVMDHLCRVRHCVNPDHLEPVTPAENLRRSELTTSGRVRCAKCGGPLSAVRAQRRCLPCNAAYEESRREVKRNQERERRARKRAAA